MKFQVGGHLKVLVPPLLSQVHLLQVLPLLLQTPNLTALQRGGVVSVANHALILLGTHLTHHL